MGGVTRSMSRIAERPQVAVEEDVYYGDGVDWLTSERVVLEDRSFWLKDIRKARLASSGTDRQLWVYLVIFAVGALYFSWPLVSAFLQLPAKPLDFWAYMGLVWLAILLVSLWYAFRSIRQDTHSTIYSISLGPWYNRRATFACLDRLYASHLVHAINLLVEKYEAGSEESQTIQGIDIQPPQPLAPDDVSRLQASAPYYIDGTLLVTDSYISTGQEEYEISAVRAVDVSTPQNSGSRMLAFFLSYFVASSLSYVLRDDLVRIGVSTAWADVITLAVTAGVLAILLAGLTNITAQVTVTGSFGRALVAACTNSARAATIAETIKQAISNNGKAVTS